MTSARPTSSTSWPERRPHSSGLCAASAATRRSFVTDLANLTLADPKVNSAKGSKDFSQWRPDHNACWTAARIVKVKRLYSLSVDEPEHAALQHWIGPDGLCGSFELNRGGRHD